MPITTQEFDYVREFVRQKSAIVLDPGKEYLVESRLGPLAKQHGLETIGQLVERLRRNDAQIQNAVVDAMTTNETSFFRDLHPFEALKTTVVPDLLAKRARERKLDIWCAACSSGQEPYTINMILRETFGGQLAGWQTKILATDLSTEMLAKAREGRYAQIEANRGLPAPLLVKYFDRAGMGWTVKPELKQNIDFRQLNLVTPWPPMPRMDIIFIRNVLIYFDVETKRLIFNRLAQLLKPDGYLFLGAAETTVNIHDGFQRLQIDKAGCYQLRG
jgi:chemotaxis protein methyltransferase CheR